MLSTNQWQTRCTNPLRGWVVNRVKLHGTQDDDGIKIATLSRSGKTLH